MHYRGIAVGILAVLPWTTPVGAAAATAESASNAVIEEVLVTARKREERAIDTPVAVWVMGTEELERYNTRNMTELTQRVPGLQITEGTGGGAGGNITIRGIGKPPGTADYGIDAPVSLVIDGMPFSRNHMIATGLFDNATIEVLKGPQALYFGKNSPAGVIAINSVSPEVGGDVEGFLRAQYEFETEDPVFEGGLSVPVGDHWAFRFAARYQDMDGGYIDNVGEPIDVRNLYPGFDFSTREAWDEYPAQEQTVTRFTAVWEPAENFGANFKWFYSDNRRVEPDSTVLYFCVDGPGAHPTYSGLFPDPTQTCPDNEVRLQRSAALPPAGISAEGINVNAGDERFYELEQDVLTLELDWNVGDFTVTSISGYWDYKHREHTDYGYTAHAVVGADAQGESGEAFTQELRLASNFAGPVNFFVGAFYEDAERTLNAPVQILPGAFLPGIVPYQAGQFPGDEIYDGTFINYHQIWDNETETISAFASVDWTVTPRLEVSGGVRYTKEDRQAFGGNVFSSGGLGFSPSQVFYDPEDESSNFSPELTVSYDLTDEIMIYGAYKTGFQSAGISNPGTVPNLAGLPEEEQNDTLIFDETTIQGFEVGTKGTLFDRRMRLELSAFAYELEDLQVGIFNSNTTTFTLQNAAVAHNWGFEAVTQYQLNERLQLRLSGQYNYLEYDEWEDAGCHPIDGALPFDVLDARTGVGTECYIGPEGVAIQDLSGVQYGGPPVQIMAGFTYDAALMREWRGQVDWDTIYHSEGEETLNQENTDVPSRHITNIAARLYQDGGSWEVGLICSNCFDQKYPLGITNRPLAKIDPGVSGDLVAQVGRPRLVTLQLTYRL